VLSFPGLFEPISIEGIVRWTRQDGEEGDGGAGIEFAEGESRDQLAAVVERIRSRDPRTMTRAFRVLVVEDNRHVATLLQEGLRGSSRRDFGGSVSFVFRNAEDGRAAVEILRQERFDALIIDVYLPIIDGPKVIFQARTELGLAALPIIAVSAGGEPARRAALDAGANIFLDKPMRLRQVIDTIQRLLQI
jgi:CheY-like chemotaxis protein